MDVMLPGGDGVALTERIKSTPDLAAIPVVMLTGEARLDTLVRSMEASAADFIVKPFTREALVAKLEQVPAALLRPALSAHASGRRDRDAAELTRHGRAGRTRIALGIEAVEQLALARPRDRQARQLDVAAAADLRRHVGDRHRDRRACPA